VNERLLRRSAPLVALAIGLLIAPAAVGKKPPPPAKGGKHVLVVDDDKAQCTKADFTTIQAAVTAASAGTKILVCTGTYHEAVNISTSAKNGLKLVAMGAPGTVVMEGEMENPAFLAAFHLTNVSGILIRGFTIRDYHEAGILLGSPPMPGVAPAGATDNRIRKNDISMSHHDGIALYNSARNLIEHNYVHDNPSEIACGIQIGFSGSDNNVVRHNRSVRNGFGIRLNDGASNNVVFRNTSNHNRRFGILNRTGASGTRIANNRTFSNTGTGTPPTEGRGIAVTTGSTGVKVVRNHAFFNTLDLFWDGSGSATFAKNHCKTSVPAGLCAHQEGK
jgi:parallel beta-helix repeat protein